LYLYYDDAIPGGGRQKVESWLSELIGILLQPPQVFVTNEVFP
jgi:hypothetical protein